MILPQWKSSKQTKSNPARFACPACRRTRPGATLIDVVTGSMLMATLLIPSLHLINESRENSHRLDVRSSLLADAEQVIEQTKIALAEPTVFAAAASKGIDNVQKVPTQFGSYAVSRTIVQVDKTASPAVLLTVAVDVWYDDDRDGEWDTGETKSTLRTQVARP